MDLNELRSRLKLHGQDHLLAHWDHLIDEEKKSFYKELSSFNYGEVKQYFNQCIQTLNQIETNLDDHLEPIPAAMLGSVTRTNPEVIKQYEQKGLKEISEDRVAVILLAGGQGTRLGVNYPKGMFNVGLPSQKTLYHLQAERIIKVQELAAKAHGKQGVVPWYIMTSEATMETTRTFFQNHKYFGLSPDNVMFFEQGMLPCSTFEGKIILENTHKIARAPDGNGGLYKALGKSGVLSDLQKRGIQYLHVYCVDNILVKMADPVFIGFCIEKGAPCGAKVVEKSSPTEAVGVVCKVDGVYQVVEYSEITLATAERRNPDGRLTFNAGNIANHFFTVDFIKEVVNGKENELIHHVAKKKIPYYENGETKKPKDPNGIKMEKFVFDVFKFAKELAVWEVLREDEFSPLKNAEGAAKDTASTSRHALYNLHRRYITNAGGRIVERDGSLVPDIPSNSKSARLEEVEDVIMCEISPLLSYAGEGLEALVKGKTFQSPLILKAPGENNQESVLNSNY